MTSLPALVLAVDGGRGLSKSHTWCLPPYGCALVTDNHAQLSRASLRIRILDVNDNPPELATPYEADVCEDAEPGQVALRGWGLGVAVRTGQDTLYSSPEWAWPHLRSLPPPHPSAHPDHQCGRQRRAPGRAPLLLPPGARSSQQPSFLSAQHPR